MPVTVTCPDHPELGHMYPGDIIQHATAEHPGEPLAVVNDRMVVRGSTQAAERGVTVTRRFRCRYCAVEVVTIDPDRAPYCTDHMDRADG